MKRKGLTKTFMTIKKTSVSIVYTEIFRLAAVRSHSYKYEQICYLIEYMKGAILQTIFMSHIYK